MKNIILLLPITILFAGCFPTTNKVSVSDTNTKQNNISNEIITQDKSDENIVCTDDVKHCPQGFYVSRTLPDCKFPACPEMEKASEITKPIAEFEQRINKKPFGIYITPDNSPVQPERFIGYHTGVDVEYDDTHKEIPVVAIADGTVKRSDWISGYGGMIAIEHVIDAQKYLVVYGHLDPNTITSNAEIKTGETIGYLGLGHSQETDNERKHLHFSVYTGTDINIRGYTQNKTELNKWIDPLTLYK